MTEASESTKLTMANSKKEMLQAYQRLLREIEEKARAEMKPEETVAQRQRSKAIQVADTVSSDTIGNQIASLRTEIGKSLNGLADRLEQETAKYVQVQAAVQAAEAELREIYDIQKAAASLVALLESQKRERDTFEKEMAAQREQLEGEIETHRDVFDDEVKTQREQWKKEKADFDASTKERNSLEEKRRQREQEEWKYNFVREKQAAEEQRQTELARLDREIHLKKEQLEKVLSDREQAVAAAEAELQSLRLRAESFPSALEQSVARAVEESTERLERERRYALDLLQKEFDGERNVLKSRIESLQHAVDKQTEQIAKLSQQLEHSYVQVQNIAMKAIEGSSGLTRSLGQTTTPLADRIVHGPRGD